MERGATRIICRLRFFFFEEFMRWHLLPYNAHVAVCRTLLHKYPYHHHLRELSEFADLVAVD